VHQPPQRVMSLPRRRAGRETATHPWIGSTLSARFDGAFVALVHRQKPGRTWGRVPELAVEFVTSAADEVAHRHHFGDVRMRVEVVELLEADCIRTRGNIHANKVEVGRPPRADLTMLWSEAVPDEAPPWLRVLPRCRPWCVMWALHRGAVVA